MVNMSSCVVCFSFGCVLDTFKSRIKTQKRLNESGVFTLHWNRFALFGLFDNGALRLSAAHFHSTGNVSACQYLTGNTGVLSRQSELVNPPQIFEPVGGDMPRLERASVLIGHVQAQQTPRHA